MVQKIKNLPAIQETWVQSLFKEDPLEKERSTYASTGISHRASWRVTVRGLPNSDLSD